MERDDLFIKIVNEQDRVAVAVAMIKNGYVVSFGKRKDASGKTISVILYREKNKE